MPLPVIIGRQISSQDEFSVFSETDGEDREPDSALEIGYFLSAAIFTCAMVLPIYFWFVGNIVFY